jgi:hypothetical protein
LNHADLLDQMIRVEALHSARPATSSLDDLQPQDDACIVDRVCPTMHDIMVLFVYRLPSRAMHLPSQDNGHHPPLPRPRWSKSIHLPRPDPFWGKSGPHVVQFTWSAVTVAQTNLGTSRFTCQSPSSHPDQPGTSRLHMSLNSLYIPDHSPFCRFTCLHDHCSDPLSNELHSRVAQFTSPISLQSPMPTLE